MSSQKPKPEKKKHVAREPLDEALQRELDEALGQMSLEEILDAEQDAQPGAPSADGVRTGTVIAVHGDDVFVELGAKSQGILPAAQFDEEPLPAVGDTVEVTIEGYDEADGLLMLSRKGAVLAATWDTLEVGQVVEARVTGHNKGGLELSIDGVRAFMPVSMIEITRVEELAPYDNRKLTCEVMEIDRRQENVIVSRRAVLERQFAEARQQTLDSLEEGKVVVGVVRSIMPYGAFVDIGGLDGLLHVSDMSHRRVEDPHEIVAEGQQIEVKVLKIDREEDRISLGLKQTLPDPWAGAEAKWRVDEVVAGRVTKLADFGAFVELEEGVEGLVPISEMSFERRVKHPSQIVAEGDAIKVRILSVDAERKRLSLSIKRVGDDPWVGASVRWAEGSVVQGVVTRLADFGAFVELVPGVEGLVHISELAPHRVRSAAEVVREGQLVGAKVLEVDEERRRIALSIKQLAEMPDYTGTEDDRAGPAQARPPRKRPLKGGLD